MHNYKGYARTQQIGGNRGVLLQARALREQGRGFTLALVTRTEGSTYRKSGALALVADDGSQSGAISGGCLEPALRDAARRALVGGEDRMLVFDTRSDDDLVFGSGSGCRGRMQVALIPVAGGREHALFDSIAGAGSQSVSLGLRANGTVALPGDDAATDARVVIPPGEQVLLIGSGPETAPLLRIAHGLGWTLHVTEHRPQALAEYAIDADASWNARPREALLAIGSLRHDAAVVMSHTASTDLEALRALALRDVAYIGLLGPPARRDELLAQLEAGEREALVPRLHAPVGLRLGGDGPDPLALSIAAGLQQFFANRP